MNLHFHFNFYLKDFSHMSKFTYWAIIRIYLFFFFKKNEIVEEIQQLDSQRVFVNFKTMIDFFFPLLILSKFSNAFSHIINGEVFNFRMDSTRSIYFQSKQSLITFTQWSTFILKINCQYYWFGVLFISYRPRACSVSCGSYFEGKVMIFSF